MRAKRKRQRRVIALSKNSDVYDPVDKLRLRNLSTHRERVSQTKWKTQQQKCLYVNESISSLKVGYYAESRQDYLWAYLKNYLLSPVILMLYSRTGLNGAQRSEVEEPLRWESPLRWPDSSALRLPLRLIQGKLSFASESHMSLSKELQGMKVCSDSLLVFCNTPVRSVRFPSNLMGGKYTGRNPQAFDKLRRGAALEAATHPSYKIKFDRLLCR